MPLSPHEERVLAGVEEQLRADAPELAAALGAGPRTRPAPPVRPWLVLVLALALAGLAVVGTVAGDRLGPAGLAVVTAVVAVPWLVAAARSARRPGAQGLLLLVTLPALATLAVLPAFWAAALGLLLSFSLLPVIAWFALRRPERRGTPR